MKPLVVDLDGTLIKTDLLMETANRFVTRNPFRIYKILQWLARGKVHLKLELAERAGVIPASLPYHEFVVDWLKEQKSQGRTLILATASCQALADEVAGYLGVFDSVMGTDGDTNLKSHAKRDRLVERFGHKGFDYVGNDYADLSVWESSDRAYVVSNDSGLVKKARNIGNVEHVFETGKPGFVGSMLKALRPHQWVKNFLVFIPLIMAQRYGDVGSVFQAVFAFLVFGMTASSVYLLNDLVDVEDDRHHARKRKRPFAAGNLSLLHGWLAWPIVLLAAFGVSLAILPIKFVGVLAVYFGLTLAYSFRLKRAAMVDVITLAALYTLRIIAGAAAISVPLSFWLLAFSMFIFLSLAFIKRYSELRVAAERDKQKSLRGRGYSPDDLEAISTMGIGAGYMSVLVLALYVNSDTTAALYRNPHLIWLACPVLLYWISRAWLITHRGEMHDDPIVFALKDPMSWAMVLTLVVIFGLAKIT
ncbi:hypothetical protein BJI67_03230 [Acidihalobacter aeolianus]|uniref:UbiA family prenyltransferase n=1 Tax=Acidihalobacter aeolianus TaxID=2792603 RepID=A0A1D8K5J1_9GAMM|nr:UbiA family prenyltransferase [Acidihalobacter aeolianus]AOV16214.1 hypothetical protein BJI67_03230 [Acidihalobacter aeolianus]